MGLSAISLFSGAGGLDLAANISSVRTVCYVECDSYAQASLMSAFRRGTIDEAPIWDDVTTFDGKPWRGRVDIIFGGFPCQDVSTANAQGQGVRGGAKSGLWREFARIIGEVRPRYAIVENVSALLIRGLDVVLGDLATLGYDAEWDVLRACQFGAPHPRERVFVVAYLKGQPGQQAYSEDVSSGIRKAQGKDAWIVDCRASWREMASTAWSIPASWVIRDINGVAFRAHRTRLTGNGVVPDQAIPAFEKIIQMSEHK